MHIPAFYGLQARTNASRSTFQWGRPVFLRVPGVKPGYAARVKDLMAAGALTPAPPSTGTNELPTNFDATTAFPHCAKVIDDIRDQSACGCCWAFAPRRCGAASDRLCIATNITVPLSAEDACFSIDTFEGDCNGGYPTEPWIHLANTGLVTGGQFNHSGRVG